MYSRKNPLVFCQDKQPIVDDKNRLIHVRAPELPFDWSLKFWQKTNDEMNKNINRRNCQIVVLTSYQNDVTQRLYRSLKSKPLGKYPVTTIFEQEFSDREIKSLIDNEAPAQHIYIVVSAALHDKDFSRIRRIADHYKNTLQTKYVTVVFTFLGGREDKNVKPNGEYEPSTTTIRAELGGISPFVDRIITIEPHSSATQAFAAKFGMPLAPISPWELVTNEIVKRMKKKGVLINQKTAVVIRPDKGRNLAANRIGKYLKLPYVSFDKTRISGQDVSLYALSKEEQALVKGKYCIIYDDEASTMGTIYRLADALAGYGAKSIAVCLIHCKFTPGWESKIKHKLFSLVIGTDSRQSIGNINIVDNIEVVTLEPLLRDLINADIKGINFWRNPKYRKMILQE